jgi:hypothetical protein
MLYPCVFYARTNVLVKGYSPILGFYTTVGLASGSAPFRCPRLSGEKTSTEVYPLPDCLGSGRRVLDHRSISLRIAWAWERCHDTEVGLCCIFLNHTSL